MTSIAFNAGSYFGNGYTGSFSSLTVNNGRRPAPHHPLFRGRKPHHRHHHHNNTAMAMNQPLSPFGGLGSVNPFAMGMPQQFGGFGTNGMGGAIDNVRTAPFDVPYGVNFVGGNTNSIFGGSANIGGANFAGVTNPFTGTTLGQFSANGVTNSFVSGNNVQQAGFANRHIVGNGMNLNQDITYAEDDRYRYTIKHTTGTINNYA